MLSPFRNKVYDVMSGLVSRYGVRDLYGVQSDATRGVVAQKATAESSKLAGALGRTARNFAPVKTKRVI